MIHKSHAYDYEVPMSRAALHPGLREAAPDMCPLRLPSRLST